MIVLELLHQLQMDGCLAALSVSPSGAPGPLLVGVVLEQNKKTEVYLFDPRLGRALPGPGGQGVATLSDVRKQPELLNPVAGAGDKAPAKAELEMARTATNAPKNARRRGVLRICFTSPRNGLTADSAAVRFSYRA